MSYMLIGSTSTVVFEKTATVTDESPTMSSQVTSSPIEGGGKITDHVVLDPIKFTITGVVASPAEYAALEAMWRGRELLTYRGAEACDNLLITSLKRTRSRDNLGGYGFTIAFQQITITSAVFVDLRAPTMSRQDSGAAQVCQIRHAERPDDHLQRIRRLCGVLLCLRRQHIRGQRQDQPQLCRVSKGGMSHEAD